MRKLTSHIVDGDSANHQLQIEVTDEPGAGGANHRYEVTGFDTKTNQSSFDSQKYQASFAREVILFQNGPIKEFGVNGLTHEALLAIVIDRLESFQAGPYACSDNAVGLDACKAALTALQGRTRTRIIRGVEGTHTK